MSSQPITPSDPPPDTYLKSTRHKATALAPVVVLARLLVGIKQQLFHPSVQGNEGKGVASERRGQPANAVLLNVQARADRASGGLSYLIEILVFFHLAVGFAAGRKRLLCAKMWGSLHGAFWVNVEPWTFALDGGAKLSAGDDNACL